MSIGHWSSPGGHGVNKMLGRIPVSPGFPYQGLNLQWRYKLKIHKRSSDDDLIWASILIHHGIHNWQFRQGAMTRLVILFRSYNIVGRSGIVSGWIMKAVWQQNQNQKSTKKPNQGQQNQKRTCEVPTPVFQNLTLFGSRAFTEVAKLKWGHLGVL